MSAPPASAVPAPLHQPVTALWGVGAERATLLGRLGITTIEDLLLHRPHRYEDRRHYRRIAELQKGLAALTQGRVVALGVKKFRQGEKSLFELILDDGTARLHCRWWNLPFLEGYYAVGDQVVVFGKPRDLKPRTIDHPETEVIEGGEENSVHIGRIVPVYPLTEGLPQRWLRGLVWRTLRDYERLVVEPWPELGEVRLARADWAAARPAVPGGETAALNLPPATAPPPLPSRANALHMLHFPETMEDPEIARQRLALDEFISLQRLMLARRRKFERKAQALPCGGDNRLIKPFLAQLNFKPTAAQTRVLREIREDLRGTHPMRRLLQGDVGSGKTLVAACAALMTIESGFSVVVMAPTEILAEQHLANFRRWFEPLGIPVGIQTGSRKTVESRVSSVEGQSTLPPSTLDPRPSTLFIGTHALLTEGFDVPNLGLVVIDEQHKFGVAQREELVRKGRYPHLLVMTATPIPRTLGLTLYGDLDVSVIDEMPAGRGSLRTFLRTPAALPKVWEFLRAQLAQGRQAYVVYPRVDEDEAGGLKAVTKEFERLQTIIAPLRVGLLHGRLKSREKETVMAGFRANAVQVLLATSLIEVGVDVPNATVMLIENAEQFGLAQLHQLRGRIGRGAHESYCILVSDAPLDDSRRRLKVLEETSDGFRIAEADLKLRGPGELLGQQQSGLPPFRFGNLVDDLELIRQAKELAAKLD